MSSCASKHAGDLSHNLTCSSANVAAGQAKGALAVRCLLSGNECGLLHEDGKRVDVLTVGLTHC
jgi:hypothetical protein